MAKLIVITETNSLRVLDVETSGRIVQNTEAGMTHAIVGPIPVGLIRKGKGLEPAAAEERITGIALESHIPLVAMDEPFSQDQMQRAVTPAWQAARAISRGADIEEDEAGTVLLTWIAGAVFFVTALGMVGMVAVLYVLPFFGIDASTLGLGGAGWIQTR